MKALTLTQPWATLIAIGAKSIETRSWPTRYRGLLAIHAAARIPRAARQTAMAPPFSSALLKAAYNPWPHPYGSDLVELPLGAVVAIVRLVHCLPTPAEGSSWREYFGGFRLPPEDPAEARFGDYSPGRYAWPLELVERLEPPVPAKGMQGLWEWDRAGA